MDYLERGGSRTFVCFSCKTTARSAYYNGAGGFLLDPAKTCKTLEPVCPRCRKPMTCMGVKFRVPKRSSKWWAREQRLRGLSS